MFHDVVDNLSQSESVCSRLWLPDCQNAHLLLGPHYAVLDSEFVRLRSESYDAPKGCPRDYSHIRRCGSYTTKRESNRGTVSSRPSSREGVAYCRGDLSWYSRVTDPPRPADRDFTSSCISIRRGWLNSWPFPILPPRLPNRRWNPFTKFRMTWNPEVAEPLSTPGSPKALLCDAPAGGRLRHPGPDT